MKQFSLLVISVVALVLTSCFSSKVTQQSTMQQEGVVELTFSFARQSGYSTNQFAIWIEDSQNHHVKTIYATRFTANGGWSRRPSSIPMWVRQSELSTMSKTQIDTVTGATPRT